MLSSSCRRLLLPRHLKTVQGGFVAGGSTVRYNSSSLKDSYDNILVDKQEEDGVALITLNRPKALNALSDALLADVMHATAALDIDPSIGCMVLTGSKKAFAAGADISEMKSKSFEDVYGSDMFSEWQVLSLLQKPILAAVSGFCLGGGCEVAMMCDLMVCSESAKFGQYGTRVM